MNAEFQVIDLEIPAGIGRATPGQRTGAPDAGAFPHPDQGLDRGGRRCLVGRLPCKPRDTWRRVPRQVRMTAPRPATRVLPEAIALRLVHEDRTSSVVDKPAGLVVHPGAGNPRHTLQNALLGLDPSWRRCRAPG
jgi:23S rRNA-/tRNA-specific pseudouridylate synthase